MFLNSEAFGVPTSLPWKLFIPRINRPEEFINDQFFHPTFLYESIWNLIIFVILLSLFQKGIKGKIKLPAGAISCIYLITYSMGRIWIEGLRIDPLCLGGLPPDCSGGLRIAQIVSLALISLGGLGLWWMYGLKRNLPDPGFQKSSTP